MSNLPRIMLVGHGRCGKDEAGEWLGANTCLRFAGTTSKYLLKYVAACMGVDEEKCFAERHANRETWFAVGREIRKGNPGCLVRESLDHGEIVGGVRDREEVEAARNEGLVDLVVWIQNDRVPPDTTLMFGPEVADIILPNNGTLAEYHDRLRRLATAMGILVAPVPRKPIGFRSDWDSLIAATKIERCDATVQKAA